MSIRRTMTFAGLLGIGMGLALVPGCGGDSSPPDATGGTGNVGGSSGSGGTGATGDSCEVVTTPVECSETPLPTTQLVDFITFQNSGKGWGSDVKGGTSLYAGDGEPQFNAEASAEGVLQLAATVPHTGYAGAVFWIQSCTGMAATADGTATSGLRFNMGGDLAGATLKVQVQTNPTYPAEPKNNKGACLFTNCDTKWEECAPPTVTLSTVPAALDDVDIPWADFTGGVPVATTDGSQVVGLQLQVECPVDAGCPVNLQIKSISVIPQ
ncbi:MAG TPA: hypothetical protein VKY73_00945 [Polyangiaceae bacterium]|nr:hypothetical protein [Polyangiaceae bacterium]